MRVRTDPVGASAERGEEGRVISGFGRAECGSGDPGVRCSGYRQRSASKPLRLQELRGDRMRPQPHAKRRPLVDAERGQLPIGRARGSAVPGDEVEEDLLWRQRGGGEPELFRGDHGAIDFAQQQRRFDITALAPQPQRRIKGEPRERFPR